MGLFTNNKKLCPICNNPTPRLLSTKIEGMPICKECDRKVDLPDGALNQMSLSDFQEYMAFYEENQILRDTFSETYSFSFGFGRGYFVIDGNNRLFRLRRDDNSLVMKYTELKAFRILEDNNILFDSTETALKYYPSDVPERIHEMAPQIAQFVIRMREYEMLERMERMQERREREGENPPPSRPYHPRPRFDVPVPFRHFYVEVALDHPYWAGYRWEISGPSMDQYNPDIDSYLREYETKVEELHGLAVNLMELICPGAPEICGYDTAADTPVPVTPAAAENDVIEQIQKYKALLDAGVLTEDEFAAKKKQLLGI